MSSTNNPENLTQIEASVVVESAEQNPVELLSNATGLSRSRIKQAMSRGAVWITRGTKTKRLRRAKGLLQTGDKLDIYFDERILDIEPPAPVLIVHETIYSVWYKPSGLMCSGTRFGDHCAINRWVETKSEPQKPVFIVHRLDRFASGLILLAHTKQAAVHLSEQFRNRTAIKVYRVIVEGQLSEAQTITEEIDDKPAISIIKPILYDAVQNRSLLEVNIKTGRKHQIRKHLAHIGFPVVGDRQYGHSDGQDLQLTACELTIKHPKSGYRQTYTLADKWQPHL